MGFFFVVGRHQSLYRLELVRDSLLALDEADGQEDQTDKDGEAGEFAEKAADSGVH